MAPLNLAIIGCGRQGQMLIACLLAEALPDVRIQALCDIWPRNLARAQKLLADHAKLDLTGHTYEDYRQLLAREKSLDAVLIATPDGAHAAQTIACLRAGLHVYCEAPISNDLQQAKQMALAERETGKQLQIGHQRRSNPYYRQAYRLLHETTLLGQLTSAQSESNASIAESRFIEAPAAEAPDPKTLERYGYGSVKEFLNWRWFRKHGGGPFLSEGTHSIDTLSWLLDCAPTSAVVSGGRDYWKDREAFDHVILDLVTPLESGLLRALCRVTAASSVSPDQELICGIRGFMLLTEEPGQSTAIPASFLHADQTGQHPWAPVLLAGRLKRFTDTPFFEKHTNQNRSTVPPDPWTPLELTYCALRASKGHFLDTVLLACPSPWEGPPQGMCMLTPDSSDKATAPKSPFGPHLANFVEAIRGKALLNCPAEAGYRSAAIALETLKALEDGRHEVVFGALVIK
jgi:predicted dehydrogenase